MPIYVLLSRLSQQGIATLKSNPDRLREVNKDIEELGAKVLHQWATLGEFDFVNVVEAPDTATIARVSVALGARGSTRIETLPALTIDELVGIDVGEPADEVRLGIVGGAAEDGRVRRRRLVVDDAALELLRPALRLLGGGAFHVAARHPGRVLWRACRARSPSTICANATARSRR